MRKLNPKQYVEAEFNKLIFTQTSRIKSHLQLQTADITNVKFRFTDYESNQKALENLSSSTYVKTSDEYKSLFGLYDSVSQDTENIKKEIKKISEVKCPYCGISEPSHLDHFLPRAKYPEFSIYAPNLIYVCSICNSTYKRDDVITSTGERKFFNPYFDDFIETTQFLKCVVELNGDVYPSFKFYIQDLSATMPYEYSVMKNHFEAMELQNRYIDQIVKEKFRRFKNRYVQKDISIEQLKHNIDYELEGLDCENINNWEKVFWESLKDSDECLNLIVKNVI
jgi:DNA-directed RNA polymerase subunit RPC12/RpoP